jgi:two-component system invasion response regulator UvrY
MTRISVLIADDSPVIIEGLTTALGRHGIDVVGVATLTREVVPKYEACLPDAVVLDVRFGEGINGLEVARELIHKHANARIVVYSQFDQDEVIREAYRVGGSGFVTKNKPLEVLADAIKKVHDGKTFFLCEIAERLALIGLRGDSSPRAKLEAREFEVFKMMAQGKTNVEIAKVFSLSIKTISTTSQNIKDKLGLHRPAEITLLAIKHNIIEP